MPTIPARPSRITSRHMAGSSEPPRSRGSGLGSPPVTLLVFQTGAAPAGVVSTDPGAARREAGLGLAGCPVATTLAERLGHRIGGESTRDRRGEPRRPGAAAR